MSAYWLRASKLQFQVFQWKKEKLNEKIKEENRGRRPPSVFMVHVEASWALTSKINIITVFYLPLIHHYTLYGIIMVNNIAYMQSDLMKIPLIALRVVYAIPYGAWCLMLDAP